MKRIIHFISRGLMSGLLLLSCDSQNSITDPGSTHFIKFYGRDGDQTGVDMVVLPDGSAFLFGTTTPSPVTTGADQTSQWYLVKIDPKGAILGEYQFGDITLNETAIDIELTLDNNLVLVGNSYKSPTDKNVFIKIVSFDGVELKSALVALKNSSNLDTDENVASVTVLSDGFIVAGSTSNVDLKPTGPNPPNSGDRQDAMHLRFNSDLTLVGSAWPKTSGFLSYDAAVKVMQVGASQFFIFGYTNRVVPGHLNADYNFWTSSIINSTLGPNISYGPTDDEKLSSVAIGPLSTSFILSGITYNQAGTSDIYVSRLKRNLDMLASDAVFQKPLSIILGLNVPVRTSIFTSASNGFLVLANESSTTSQNWLLTKINDELTPSWKLPIIFGGEGLDNIGVVKELPDGRILMIGTMQTGKPESGETKMTLIKVNNEGKLID